MRGGGSVVTERTERRIPRRCMTPSGCSRSRRAHTRGSAASSLGREEDASLAMAATILVLASARRVKCVVSSMMPSIGARLKGNALRESHMQRAQARRDSRLSSG